MRFWPAMKKLAVVMKPSAFDLFSQSATGLGISEYEVAEVRVSPSVAVRERQRLYRGQEYSADLLTRVKVEFAVSDGAASSVSREIFTMLAPDRIAISTLEEVITAATGSDHAMQITDPKHRVSETTRVFH
jgi:nitrogen regulatory protein PII